MTQIIKPKKKYPEKVIATQDMQKGDIFEIVSGKRAIGKRIKGGIPKELREQEVTEKEMILEDIVEWFIAPTINKEKAKGFIQEDVKKGEELKRIYVFN